MPRNRARRSAAAAADRRRREERPHFMDYATLFLVLFLLGFGLVILFSTSSYRGSMLYGDTAHWLKRQGFFAIVGVLLMLLVSRIDYHWLSFKIVAFGDYMFILALLTATMAIGYASHGSQRWLSIGPISFQPSELAKVCLIVFLAWFLSTQAEDMQKWSSLWKPYFFALVLTVIVAVENLSTAVILLLITTIMVFVINPKFWPFVLLGILGAGGVWFMIQQQGYRMSRIEVWLSPETAENGEQTMAALYAIGSGGLFGKGLGQSMQKMILPEAYNDMIFSIVCEELGLFGAICVILLFAVLLWRFLIIAMTAPDLFGSMLVVGVLAHIGSQVFVNIAVATNLAPNTGIPLPFISYGGSSLIFLLAEIGLVLSVSRYIRIRR